MMIWKGIMIVNLRNQQKICLLVKGGKDSRKKIRDLQLELQNELLNKSWRKSNNIISFSIFISVNGVQDHINALLTNVSSESLLFFSGTKGFIGSSLSKADILKKLGITPTDHLYISDYMLNIREFEDSVIEQKDTLFSLWVISFKQNMAYFFVGLMIVIIGGFFSSIMASSWVSKF